MAINITDFDKIWASTSPLTPYAFSDANYQQGWNFVGATPPARQMWDSYMKWSDEKQQYIVNNFLPLSGGTMTGNIFNNNANDLFSIAKDQSVLNQGIRVYGGNSFSTGASLYVYGKDNTSYGGIFRIFAHDGTNSKELRGNPNGELTWDGNDIVPQKSSTNNSSSVNIPNNSTTNVMTFSLDKGTWLVHVTATFSSNVNGYRFLYISNTSTGTQIDRYKVARTMAVNGAESVISLTTIMEASTTTTFYVNVNQNSGSTLSVGGGVKSFRLSSVV